MRILQISDTHISAEHHDFSANGAVIARAIAELKPDMIINTGDLSMNGAISAADLDLARDWHDKLGVPFLAVPGNHDVGDTREISADQTVNDERLARFRAIAGQDRWTHDIDGWRLIGLDAMLFSTGHGEEAAQFDWLAGAVETDAKIAIFMHKPLFIDEPGEGPRGYWTVLPTPRQRLLDILNGRDVRLVASGHLHIARKLQRDGVTHIWSPASSFVCGDSQEDLGGERRVGFVDYTFDANGFTSTFVFPAAAKNLLIEPVGDRIYPKPQPTAA